MDTKIGLIVTTRQALNVTACFATIGNMELPQEKFSDRLNALCDEAGIPPKGKGRQLSVAKIFGVHQKAARKWLEGEGVPEYQRCYTIAAHFNVNFEWLMMGRGAKRQSDGLLITDPDLIRLAQIGQSLSKQDRAAYIRMGSALAEPPAQENGQ